MAGVFTCSHLCFVFAFIVVLPHVNYTEPFVVAVLSLLAGVEPSYTPSYVHRVSIRLLLDRLTHVAEIFTRVHEEQRPGVIARKYVRKHV